MSIIVPALSAEIGGITTTGRYFDVTSRDVIVHIYTDVFSGPLYFVHYLSQRFT